MTESLTLAGLPHAGTKSKTHQHKQYLQKMKYLPETWLIRGKQFEDFRGKKMEHTSSLDQTTPLNTLL